ncbi:MAG: ribosome biogenesis GTPase Der [Firmicutes bacterium]|nr:ribosome biogenesis GTPase Der [Bacillota bacterium]
MDKPIVAIVGRPNVGKSTFFNKMAGKRISIVNNMPGVTRDRIYADVDWCGYSFTLIDTGGIELNSDDAMWTYIRRAVDLAVDTANVILFVVDGKTGITSDDYNVASYLRKAGKPVVLAVNKVDSSDNSPIYDFYELNLGEPFPISAEQSLGLGDLLDGIVKHFGDKNQEDEEEDNAISIAVVGKPNAGKSSLVNKLLGYERVIVSPIAGTTRDAVDTRFKVGNQEYVIIDTAGIRKKAKVSEDVEYYSVIRAISAIRKADVVLAIIDASESISEQDLKILGLAHEAGRPSVVVMNKWDLIEKDTNTVNEFNKTLKTELKFMDYFKSIYISAHTGKRVDAVLSQANEVYKNASRRISTGTLNDVIGDAIAKNELPHKNGKRLKLFYATQPSANPPTFILFVNDPQIMHFSYRRYLENELRKAFDFSGTPIRIVLRANDEE